MAQLIKAQSQVKPLFNGDGMLIGFEPRDQSIISLRSHKRKIKFNGSGSSRVFASSSSSVSSSESYKFKQPVNSDKSCYDIGYDLFYDDPEYLRDDLSCFRGLVLDISYRYFVILNICLSPNCSRYIIGPQLLCVFCLYIICLCSSAKIFTCFHSKTVLYGT